MVQYILDENKLSNDQKIKLIMIQFKVENFEEINPYRLTSYLNLLSPNWVAANIKNESIKQIFSNKSNDSTGWIEGFNELISQNPAIQRDQIDIQPDLIEFIKKRKEN